MYNYDVFISYKTGGSNDEWMNDLFMPWFREKLDNAFANLELPEPQIFIDKSEIKNGSDWQIAIKQAVAHSKMMVAICTPTYFRRSEWCLREFTTMYYRAKKLGYLTATKNSGLVQPLMRQMVSNLPLSIKAIQFLDYSQFNQVGPAFKQTSAYLEFQKRVEKDAQYISKVVKDSIPEWNPKFETDEWTELPFDQLFAELNINEPKQMKPGWEQ
ncbi:MAG: toll/interleukin-1 receptor domain-containing protein [Chryseolinea sp.]